ncbi:MAG: hypothetical protein ACPGVA_02060 [Pikeienuella sp.]
MKRGWGFVSGSLIFGAHMWGAASAGPWTQEPGETFSMLSLKYLTTQFSETSDATFRQPTLSTYVEHGWREAITVGAEVDATLGIPAKGALQGGGGARVFGRTRLWTSEEGEIISAEASIGFVAEPDQSAHIQPRLSFLYGEGYEHGWYDLATSIRFDGTTIDELHSDATYGYRPAEGWVTYFQATTIQRVRPRLGEDITTTRFGLFVGYEISSDRTLVVGARREFFTVFAPPALEASISLWARF